MADANPTPSCSESETPPTSAATATIIPFPQGSREYAQHGVALTAALALIRYGSDCSPGECDSLQWLVEHCGTLVGGVPDEVVVGLPTWAATVRGSFERGRGLPGILQRVLASPEAEPETAVPVVAASERPRTIHAKAEQIVTLLREIETIDRRCAGRLFLAEELAQEIADLCLNPS